MTSWDGTPTTNLEVDKCDQGPCSTGRTEPYLNQKAISTQPDTVCLSEGSVSQFRT